MPNQSEIVRIRRRMPAPREVVYEAWTTGEGLRYWMWPGDVIPAEATLDVRVGGTFRIVMKTPTEKHVQTGTMRLSNLQQSSFSPGSAATMRQRRSS